MMKYRFLVCTLFNAEFNSEKVNKDRTLKLYGNKIIKYD